MAILSTDVPDQRRRRRQWTLALVIMAALLERADEALLPAVYREVGAALGASPAALGSLTLCRALVQAVRCPLAAWAAVRYDRARVVAAGALLWAVATMLVGVSGTYLQMAIPRGFNGVGLALVVPAIYSLVADYSDDTTRGSAFGWISMASRLGSMLGGSLGVLLAPTAFLGIPGWQLAFHIFAFISAVLAGLTWLLASDPRPGPGPASGSSKQTTASVAKALLAEAKDVVRVPTFQIIVAQGVAGSVPWSALTFVAMWLELVGFTHLQTSVITTLNPMAGALGALIAGYAGYALARRFPDAGRVLLAQVSTASTIPIAAVLLLALPVDPSAGAAYAVRRRLPRLGLRHALVPLGDQQSYIRGDRAGEGEDDGLRAGQVLRDGLRLVRASRRRHPGGAGLWVQASRARGRQRRDRPGERRRAGKGRFYGDRSADRHLLHHLLIVVLHVPGRQRSCAKGSSGGVRRHGVCKCC